MKLTFKLLIMCAFFIMQGCVYLLNKDCTQLDEVSRSLRNMQIVTDTLIVSKLKDSADMFMRKKSESLDSLQSVVYEDQKAYYVKYCLMKKNIRGGGAIIAYDKKSLEQIMHCFGQ